MITINGDEYWNSRGVSSILNIGRNFMLREMRKLGILKHNNTPTQDFARNNVGYFFVQQSKYNSLTTYYSSECIGYLKEALQYMPRTKKPYRPKECYEPLNDDLVTLLAGGW